VPELFSGETHPAFYKEKIDKLMSNLLKALPGAPIFPEAVFDGAPGALRF